MKHMVKRLIKGIAALSIALLLAGPAMAAYDKQEANPATQGAKDAYSLLGKSAEDTVEKTRDATEKLSDKTREATQKTSNSIKKANEKVTEGSARAWDAMTQDKVQAGVSGGLAVGLPVAGGAYLLAMTAGMSNPVTAALITGAAVTGLVGHKTAQHYENTHEQ